MRTDLFAALWSSDEGSLIGSMLYRVVSIPWSLSHRVIFEQHKDIDAIIQSVWPDPDPTQIPGIWRCDGVVMTCGLGHGVRQPKFNFFSGCTCSFQISHHFYQLTSIISVRGLIGCIIKLTYVYTTSYFGQILTSLP